MDGAFTELKRAHEATVKSTKVKRQQIDSCLKSNREEDSEQSGVESSSNDKWINGMAQHIILFTTGQ